MLSLNQHYTNSVYEFMRAKKENDIELLLSKLDKEHLCEFIKAECTNNKQLKQRFLALGAETIFTPQHTDYQARVEEIIEDFEGPRGYVSYRDTFALNRAVSRILDEADEAISNHRWEVAIAVLEGVAATGEDIICCGDDSAGELGCVVEDCFSKWHELCHEELLPAEVKNKIFELSISYFEKGHLKGYDWWWDWIEMAILLANTPQKQERIVNMLDTIINTHSDDWNVEHNAQTAQRYKLEVMSRSGTPEEQLRFMYDNVNNPDFRRKLLQLSWDKGDYEEVLRLAKDGVKHDSQLPGLVNDWHKWELKVYRHKNDKTNILKLAQYFFFARGGFGEKEYSMEAMYALMKSNVPNEKWSSFVDSLIKEASKKRTEVEELFIYTQEKMWDRYMDFLRKNSTTYKLDDAPREMWKLYNEEMIQLYASCIKRFFQHASDRNAYRNGVSLLRQLVKYGGRNEADAIVVELKTIYPRRPALLDELSKL